MSFHSTKKQQKKKKATNGALTPAVLARRVRQLSEARAEVPEKATSLVEKPKGTLEQIGHEADAAWNGVKKIMALLNTEMKHVYYNNASNVTQAGTVLDLTSLISQGVGGNQRIGDSLKIKRVECKCGFRSNSAATNLEAGTFVLGMSRDGVPAVADVFAVVSASTSGHAFPTDTYDRADHWVTSKFKAVSAQEPVREFVLAHTFNHDVIYQNASTASASGCVWLAFIGNEPTNFQSLWFGIDIAFLDN